MLFASQNSSPPHPPHPHPLCSLGRSVGRSVGAGGPAPAMLVYYILHKKARTYPFVNEVSKGGKKGNNVGVLGTTILVQGFCEDLL